MTISTANVDAGSDSPRLARAQIKETIDTVNNLETSSGSAGVGFIQSGTGAVATTVQDELRQRVNVKQFGAVGNGVADDTAAIQLAINYIQTFLSTNCPTLYFPTGIYLISSGLTATTSGNHFRVKGSGFRSVQIRATAAMATMLTLGQSVGVFQQMQVDGLWFNGNYLADVGVDATYLRYAIVEKNRFTGFTAGGNGLKIGRWVNRVLWNQFEGQDGGGAASSVGLYVPSDTVNNLVALGNSFTSCTVGIQSQAHVNDLQISYNNFDTCTKAAVASLGGSRNLVICKNYFENCGNTTASNGVDITKVSGGTANYSAPIVAQWLQASSAYIENLVIEDNEFANCVNTGLSVLSGVSTLSWRKNHALKQYTYTYAVRLVEFAASENAGKGRGIVIEQADHNSNFTELVQLGGATKDSDHSGIQVIWHRGAVGGGFGPREVSLGNPGAAPWTVTGGAITTTTNFETLFPIYTFNTTADTNIVFSLDQNQKWLRGRYFRIGYLTRGEAASNNGVYIDVQVDTGAGYASVLASARTSTTWIIGCRNALFFVPDNAIGLKIRLYRGSAASNSELCNLVFEAASAPLRAN